MACTTPGSARVDVSPSSLSFLTAILRRMRLMILPDLVFGSPEHSTSRRWDICSPDSEKDAAVFWAGSLEISAITQKYTVLHSRRYGDGILQLWHMAYLAPSL